MRNALKKRDALARFIALYERRPGKFDQELKELSAQFCGIAFDPSACPELAEKIEAKLEAAKQDPGLKGVIEEIKKNCLPRQHE
jgi:hypothetical protein